MNPQTRKSEWLKHLGCFITVKDTNPSWNQSCMSGWFGSSIKDCRTFMEYIGGKYIIETNWTVWKSISSMHFIKQWYTILNVLGHQHWARYFSEVLFHWITQVKRVKKSPYYALVRWDITSSRTPRELYTFPPPARTSRIVKLNIMMRLLRYHKQTLTFLSWDAPMNLDTIRSTNKKEFTELQSESWLEVYTEKPRSRCRIQFSS